MFSMGVRLSQNVHSQNKPIEIKSAEAKSTTRDDILENLNEERLLLANETLKRELKKKEEKVHYYMEDAILARKVVVEYANSLSTIKERERQLRSSIASILNQKHMSDESKLNIITSYLEQENPQLTIDLSWVK